MRPCIEFDYPEFSGCYSLLKGGRVTYVGKSLNVLQRLSGHRNRLRRLQQGKSVDYRSQSRVIIVFDSVRIYPCPTSQLDQLERELVLLYNPELNKQVPRPVRVIDIRALAKRANVDLAEWRDVEFRRYKPKRDYRRVAA